jgi:hypothetical protein
MGSHKHTPFSHHTQEFVSSAEDASTELLLDDETEDSEEGGEGSPERALPPGEI